MKGGHTRAKAGERQGLSPDLTRRPEGLRRDIALNFPPKPPRIFCVLKPKATHIASTVMTGVLASGDRSDRT